MGSNGMNQTDGTRDSLTVGQIPARSRLKSRKDFQTSVKLPYFPAKVVRCDEWQRRQGTIRHGHDHLE